MMRREGPLPLLRRSGERESDAAGRRHASAARDSATVAGWTLVSRVTGLLRILTIGAVLGPTYFANTFQAGYVVPQLVYTLIAGQILAMVLVPALVRAIASSGVGRAVQVVSRIGGLLLVLAVALAALLALAAPLVAWTLTFGIPDEEVRARARDLTILVVLFVAPQVVLYTVATLHAAAQHARGRFALAAAAPSAENAGVIATMGLAAVLFGFGAEANDVPVGMVLLLGAGSTASVAIHAALQVYGAARVGLATRPALTWRSDQAVRDVARRLRRALLVAASQAGALYTVLALAATVPGGVFVLQVAYAVHSAVIAVGAHAVSTAVLPRLSAAAARADLAGFAEHWRRGISYALMVSVPALALIAVFAEPAAGVLSRGEADSAMVIAQLAACLTVVAATQLAGGLHNFGDRALYARLADRGPRRAAVTEFLVTAGVGLAALFLLPADTPRLVALAVAILAGESAGALVVSSWLRTALAAERFIDLRALAPVASAAGLMLPLVVGGWWLWNRLNPGGLAEVGLLAVCGLTAVAVYAGAVRIGVMRRIEHRGEGDP